MKIESPWSNHLKIAIRVWSRDRARQMAEKALQVPTRNLDMEHFLTELLTDALLTFNEDYNKAYNEQVQRLQQLLEELQARTLPMCNFDRGGRP